MHPLIAIPVYNEEAHVERVLDQVRKYASDILVIDDGSSDGTADLLSRHPDIAVLTHPRNRGYGAALISAFTHALTRPEAAFYNFFSVEGVTDTMAFCKKLAREYKVGLAPGEAFAAGGPGSIRLCFASGPERLSRGLDRIEAAVKAL